MQSRLLKNLLAQAESTKDRVSWAKAVCRAASHYARHGDHEHASEKIRSVRAEFESDHNAEVGVWLILAEAITHFFEIRPGEAYDRARRAYALAKALKLDESALPTCAAWMAHLEFNRGNYPPMIEYLREALTRMKSTDHQAGSRANLVLADAYHFGGSFEKAKPWYEKCRRNATAEEDDATLSALFHNIAAFRAANVRLSSAFGQLDEAESRRAMREAESARAFDALLQGHGLELLFPLLRGQLLAAESKFADAFKLLGTIKIEGLHDRLKPLLLAETAWCELGLGSITESWNSIISAMKFINSDVDADDLAYIYARASLIAQAAGRSLECKKWREESLELIGRHRGVQRDILERLDGLTSSL